MMDLSNQPIRAVPKPQSTKKSRNKNSEKLKRVEPIGESKTRAEINNRNRGFGKSVERHVAKLVEGDRVPASGAIKTSNLDLTGDVQVKDGAGSPLAKIECKGTSTITPSGDKTFILKKSVLEQTFREAEAVSQIGVTWLHWLNAEYAIEDYAIIESRHFVELLRLAKLGSVVDKHGRYPI